MSATDKLVVENLFKIFGGLPEPAVELYRRGLCKQEILERTGLTIGVCDASFAVREGEIFVVMGLSGSGKSTLVRLLNRLIEPSSGRIFIGGQDIASISDRDLLQLRRRRVSMVFQSFALMPHLNVVRNVAFGLELAGVDAGQREERARAALEQVGLACWAESYPSELSGGMQQRVGLARALANDPEILLMDEAFSALDPLIRAEMQDELLRLQEDSKRTVIFISHDLDEAFRIGDRIAIMEGGRVVQVGTPDDILKNPADDYVRAFFRGVNVGTVLTAGDIARKQQVTVIDREESGVKAVLQRMGRYDRPHAYVVDKRQVFHGVVSVESLEAQLKTAKPNVHDAILPEIAAVPRTAPLSEIMGLVAASPCGIPVVDDTNRYLGVVSRAVLLEALDRENGGRLDA